MQQSEQWVVLYLQYVRVSADEELRRSLHYLSAYARVVLAGVATDVLHQYLHLLTLEAQHFGEHEAQVTAVAVAADGTQRTKLSQALREHRRADVATVPYLVAWFEVFQVAVVPVGVGVADYAYLFHRFILLLIKSAMNSFVPSGPRRDALTQRS